MTYFAKLITDRKTTPEALATEFDVSVRTIRNWMREGVPQKRATEVAGFLRTHAKRIVR